MSSYNTNFNVGDNDKRTGTIIPSHIWHKDDYGSNIMPILEMQQINNLISIINDLDNRISSLESNVTYQSHSIQLVLNSQNANATSPITQDISNSNYAEWGITVQPGYEVEIISGSEYINGSTTGYQGQGWTINTEFIEWRIQTRALRDSDKPNITIEIQTRQRPTYQLVFNENGGSIPINPWHVYQNFAIMLPSYTGQYDSMHEFAGWTTIQNGSTVYPVGSPFTVTGNTTLYAKWKEIVLYTIVYDLNNGSGTTPSSETVKKDTSIILPSGNGISRSGYTFKGWNTQPNGNGTHYDAGYVYTYTGTSTTTITLYAEWEEAQQQCTITFNTNGGSGSVNSQQALVGASIILPSYYGAKANYTFGGWNTNLNGTGTTYQAGDSYTVTGNTTLYAKWNADEQQQQVDVHTLTLQFTSDSALYYGTNSPRSQEIQDGDYAQWIITASDGYRIEVDNSDYALYCASFRTVYTRTWELTSKTMSSSYSYNEPIIIKVKCVADTPQTIDVSGISIDKTTLSMDTGTTASLTGTISPSNATNQNVMWSSSNTSVVNFTNSSNTVSGNSKVLVAGANGGTATVTAIAAGNTSIKVSCNVNVIGRTQSVVPINSVTVNPSSITVNEGETTTFTYSINPSDATDKTLTWGISNQGVINLSTSQTNATSGTITVTGISAGEGTINLTWQGKQGPDTIHFICNAAQQPSTTYYFSVGTTEVTANNYTTANNATTTIPTTKTFSTTTRGYGYVLAPSNKTITIVDNSDNGLIPFTEQTSIVIANHKVYKTNGALGVGGTIKITLS